jgi:pimeloyl-ACP methyl ester carboxylesterase
MVEWLVRKLPNAAVKVLLWGYSRYAGFRHRHAPEVRESLEEFVRRRLESGDREAMARRLELIRGADPRLVARTTSVPVWALAGFWDPVVPWWPVSRWLSRECPRCQGREMIWGADHNVLATQPDQAAGVIRRWMALAGMGEKLRVES